MNVPYGEPLHRHPHTPTRDRWTADLGRRPARRGGEHAEGELLSDERARALYRCLAKTAPDYREALYLVYIEGMSYDEAGAIMRKTRKQVDNLVQHEKLVMRPLLAKEGVGSEVD